MAGVSITESMDTRTLATLKLWLAQKPVDQIFSKNLLLAILLGQTSGKFNGDVRFKLPGVRVRREDGGRKIALPVAYNRSTNVTSFKNLDNLPLNVDEVATMAEAQWSYYTDAAVLTWQEAQENRGKSKVFSILEARLAQALATIAERVDTDLYSTGDAVSVGNSGKNIIGIQSLLPVAPTTGIVWGLNRATYTWWRNQYDATGATFASVGLTNLAEMYCSTAGNNGEDPATLLMTTAAMWQGYHALVSAKQQVQTTKIGDLGFPTLEFMGIPIFYSSGCLSNAWYFLNLKYMFAVLQTGAVFDIIDYGKGQANQLIDKIYRIVFGGQIGFEDFRRQGCLTFTG